MGKRKNNSFNNNKHTVPIIKCSKNSKHRNSKHRNKKRLIDDGDGNSSQNLFSQHFNVATKQNDLDKENIKSSNNTSYGIPKIFKESIFQQSQAVNSTAIPIHHDQVIIQEGASENVNLFSKTANSTDLMIFSQNKNVDFRSDYLLQDSHQNSVLETSVPQVPNVNKVDEILVEKVTHLNQGNQKWVDKMLDLKRLQNLDQENEDTASSDNLPTSNIISFNNSFIEQETDVAVNNIDNRFATIHLDYEDYVYKPRVNIERENIRILTESGNHVLELEILELPCNKDEESQDSKHKLLATIDLTSDDEEPNCCFNVDTSSRVTNDTIQPEYFPISPNINLFENIEIPKKKEKSVQQVTIWDEKEQITDKLQIKEMMVLNKNVGLMQRKEKTLSEEVILLNDGVEKILGEGKSNENEKTMLPEEVTLQKEIIIIGDEGVEIISKDKTLPEEVPLLNNSVEEIFEEERTSNENEKTILVTSEKKMTIENKGMEPEEEGVIVTFCEVYEEEEVMLLNDTVEEIFGEEGTSNDNIQPEYFPISPNINLFENIEIPKKKEQSVQHVTILDEKEQITDKLQIIKEIMVLNKNVGLMQRKIKKLLEKVILLNDKVGKILGEGKSNENEKTILPEEGTSQKEIIIIGDESVEIISKDKTLPEEVPLLNNSVEEIFEEERTSNENEKTILVTSEEKMTIENKGMEPEEEGVIVTEVTVWEVCEEEEVILLNDTVEEIFGEEGTSNDNIQPEYFPISPNINLFENIEIPKKKEKSVQQVTIWDEKEQITDKLQIKEMMVLNKNVGLMQRKEKTLSEEVILLNDGVGKILGEGKSNENEKTILPEEGTSQKEIIIIGDEGVEIISKDKTLPEEVPLLNNSVEEIFEEERTSNENEKTILVTSEEKMTIENKGVESEEEGVIVTEVTVWEVCEEEEVILLNDTVEEIFGEEGTLVEAPIGDENMEISDEEETQVPIGDENMEISDEEETQVPIGDEIRRRRKNVSRKG